MKKKIKFTKKQLQEMITGIVTNSMYEIGDSEMLPEIRDFINQGIPSQELMSTVVGIVDALEEGGAKLINDKNTTVNLIIKSIRSAIVNEF